MQLRALVMSEHDQIRPSPAGAFAQQVAPGVQLTFEADRIVDRVGSGANEARVIDNAYFGRLLLVDGALRSSSADEFIVHEMMSHVPLLAHGRVERVLIVGGADFGLAEEVLKHRAVRKLVQAGTDHLALKLARAHFAGVNAPVLEDGRRNQTRRGRSEPTTLNARGQPTRGERTCDQDINSRSRASNPRVCRRWTARPVSHRLRRRTCCM